MNEAPPTPPEAARPRWVLRGLLLLALAFIAWLGWREYDHRTAIREAQAEEFGWHVKEPIALIREDWNAAFRRATWTGSYRLLYVQPHYDLATLRPLLLRLRPTELLAPECEDTDLNALKEISSLRLLNLSLNKALQNVDGIKGLSGLQKLNLSNCDALQNVDGLRGLSGLQDLDLYGCSALQNVDAIKRLSGLKTLDLRACPNLPATAVEELRAALPTTRIEN